MRSYMDFGYTMTRAARLYGERTAIIYNDQKYTWKQVNERVNQLANALREFGVKKNSKVASLLLNCNQLAETYYAENKISAIAVPLNPRLTIDEIEYILKDSEAEVLIYDHDLKKIVQEIKQKGIMIKRYIEVGPDKSSEDLNYEELISKFSKEEPSNVPSEDDIATILYTSGTTGRPKGVVRTQRSNLATAMNVCMAIDHTPDSVELYTIPMFGVGFFGFFAPMVLGGGSVVIMRNFQSEQFLQMVEKYKVTHSYCVPSMWNWIINHENFDKYDISSLKVPIWGGESMPAELESQLKTKLPHGLYGMYGSTECPAIVVASPGVTSDKEICSGRPVPLQEIRIVNAQGVEAAPGEIGEVTVKGPVLLSEYYKNKAATQKSIIDEWFYTGDLGMLDNEGLLYIVGRVKDMIISAGENIYPAEIERVLYTHPNILECAVFGLPDEKWGEAVTAVIAVKKEKTLIKEDVIEFCKLHLASYKKPKNVFFEKELPKNASGKMDKVQLLEKYRRSYMEGSQF